MRKQVLAVTIGVLLVLTIFSVLHLYQNSSFPIVYAANFGKETSGNDNQNVADVIGSSNFTFTGDDSHANNMTAEITTFGSDVLVKTMIYRASDLVLVGTTTERTINNAGYTWETFDFATEPALVSSTKYLLSVWANAFCLFHMAYASPNNMFLDSQTYGAVPDPLVPTSSNANEGSIYCSYTVDPAPPTATDIKVQRQKAATSAAITVNWTAGSGATLDDAVSILESNASESTANSTAVVLSGSSAWGNTSVTLPSAGSTVQFRFFANDSLDQWRTTDYQYFLVYSNDMALWINGNRSLNGLGTHIILKGFDYTYLMDTSNGSWYDPETGDRFYDFTGTPEEGMNYTLDFLDASGGNMIRCLTTVEFWVDNTDSYQTTVARFCELAEAKSFYFMPVFWRANSTGDYTPNPLNDPGNGYIDDAQDLIDIWDSVVEVMKAYPNWIPEVWNEPPATAEWFSTVVQPCLNLTRDYGFISAFNIAVAPNGSPLTYDFGTGYTEGFGTCTGGITWLPVIDTWLNDSLGNWMFDMHIYRSNAYETGNPGWYAWEYDDVLTWLNQTGVINASQNYVLNIGEIGSNNGVSNRTEELAWYNNTLSILDDYEVGYQQWAGPPWATSGLSMTWGFIREGANFMLSDIGLIWLQHLGGVSLSGGIVELIVNTWWSGYW